MSSHSKQYTALLPAAGIGSRMQADIPKQYLYLAGKTILETTALAFLSHPRIAQVVVVLHPDDQWFSALEIAHSGRVSVVQGGDERADSVLAGLQTITDDWVLVHDAARPCITHDDISTLIETVEQTNHGGILACQVRDTMKRGAAGKVEHTVSREQLWHALTPQMFQVQTLRQNICDALAAGASITDEASAMEWADHTVNLVEGRSDNIKVTCPEDLALARWYLSQQQNNEVVG
ncbi:2-C-methyl-D-erythritol 4-phosphate cytidylyltransferase [Agarivorans sp. MS3-6]|uniref:2-C-methyl-D-erythritol 4-phosphate cytidylyltransferase n=1 Tax=Agarivorans sp. TSD2052 TaxID=2937286 RepID=UPI00200C33EF|nr:2-C-methyl-D-erythritol 4-phosphate cytidylyltransferase [Agarivorans sp. TSD2052]UPW17417.1 2-C-methyl-D-erythritol 4-phosphate cytidylyltransferase [Agarivorans sp. TSD2052]